MISCHSGIYSNFSKSTDEYMNIFNLHYMYSKLCTFTVYKNSVFLPLQAIVALCVSLCVCVLNH